jgi:chromate transporter
VASDESVGEDSTRPPPLITHRSVSLPRLFLAFARIGLLSFGGGASTLVLMQQEMMERRRWLNAREFSFTFALSRMYPGAHLLAQAALIGHVLRGLAGAVVALLGLVLPSCLITMLFTVFFLVLRANAVGSAIIDGILPATGGMTIAVSYRLARETAQGERGRARLVTLFLISGGFTLMALLEVSSVLADQLVL